MSKERVGNRRQKYSRQDLLLSHKKTCIIAITIFFGILSVVHYCFFTDCIRFDQYMETICSTTAALTATMFGLSAASYAFVCSELRSEEKQWPQLENVLVEYRDNLWACFVYSLVFTIGTVITSLVFLGIAQRISASDLFSFSVENGMLKAGYINSRFAMISSLTFFNLMVAVTAIIMMAYLNVNIFRRENRYSKIAQALLDRSVTPYEKPTGVTERKEDELRPDLSELEKIHNIERLVERVLQNHECAGTAFAPEHRRDELLTVVFSQKLEVWYGISKQSGENTSEISEKKWHNLTKEKQASRWAWCLSNAKMDYDLLKHQKTVNHALPSDCSFVKVYNDLICYRNSRLVCSGAGVRINAGEHLRWSVKKRLLIFLLQGESFSNMDLSRISFSGADLRHTNFSDCDLSYTKMKGANCEEADFSNSRLPGLYFKDNDEICHGEIQITYQDDTQDEWNPYTGREATCLDGATFAHADVSRAFLVADNSDLWNDKFPFDRSISDSGTREWEKTLKLYSLKRTSFDYAKLYSSKFGNICFDQVNFSKALIFDSIFFQCMVRSANLAGATLTNSCLLWCDFSRANMDSVVLAQAVLLRSDFHSAQLKKANFVGANLVKCNFSGAYCQSASFMGMIQSLEEIKSLPFVANKFLEDTINNESGITAGSYNIDFSFATLSNTDFSRADISHVSFEHAIGANCIFTNAQGHRVNMNDAFLTSSILNRTTITNSSFCRTILRNSVFLGVRFKRCTFKGADFSQSIFDQDSDKSTIFEGQTMVDVNFSGSQGLSAKCFKVIKLTRCNFSNTGLRKKDFRAQGIEIENCFF